ncbi:MAG: CobW family GTP-binding protein [Candidatus Competibacterales bacterium]
MDTTAKIFPDEAQKRPVSVFTGFLGSGKTTVLNHLMAQPELRETLVLINEFGAIGLDHHLVTFSREDTVVEMANGCLCCTIRSDLLKTLSQAMGRFSRGGVPWFKRVAIEPTGLADPAPVLQLLMREPTITRHYRLDGVITTVDGVNGMDTLDRHGEAVKQAAVADRLLVTKADLAAPDTLAALLTRLRALNPAATLRVVRNGAVEPAAVLNVGLYNPQTKSLDVQNWLQAEAYGEDHHHHHHDHSHGHHHHNDVNRHDAHIQALCLTVDEPFTPGVLDRWLGVLRDLRGPDLLRLKGMVNVVGYDGPLILQGVQHVLHPLAVLDAWPTDDRRSHLVFITRDIPPGALEKTLALARQEASG